MCGNDDIYIVFRLYLSNPLLLFSRIPITRIYVELIFLPLAFRRKFDIMISTAKAEYMINAEDAQMKKTANEDRHRNRRIRTNRVRQQLREAEFTPEELEELERVAQDILHRVRY